MMGYDRAKNTRYWLRGLWLRLVRSERYLAYMPQHVALMRAIKTHAPKLRENVMRNNALLEFYINRKDADV